MLDLQYVLCTWVVFTKRKAGLNTTARLLGRKRACVENEQYEVGFAGIQHNRDDHETYAIVLPYDSSYFSLFFH